jgi:hypothetical protein
MSEISTVTACCDNIPGLADLDGEDVSEAPRTPITSMLNCSSTDNDDESDDEDDEDDDDDDDDEDGPPSSSSPSSRKVSASLIFVVFGI